jgi:hypothetical protein
MHHILGDPLTQEGWILVLEENTLRADHALTNPELLLDRVSGYALGAAVAIGCQMVRRLVE